MVAASKTNETIFATPSDREIVMTRVFDAPRHIVWDVWTKPEHLQHWMLGPGGFTMPVCEIDLRVGGAWHFVWRGADGKEMGMVGKYTKVNPPAELVSTESWGEGWPETTNTATFTEKDGRTTVVVAKVFPSKEARDQALGSGMKAGVAQSYERLETYARSLA